MSRPLVATALLAAALAGTSARGQDPRPAPTFDEIIRMRPLPPMLIARAGQDNPHLNTTVDTFVKEALAAGAPLELLNHPTGRHGFDILDDDARSREILARTFEFLKTHLD